MRDAIVSAFAFVVYYTVVVGCALLFALVSGPALLVHKFYLWAHRHAPLDQK